MGNLKAHGIECSNEELDEVMNLLRFSDNNSDSISSLEVYSNAHLYQLFESKRTPLLKRIALNSNCGLDEQDW